MGTLCAQLLQFMLILLKLHRCFGHGLKTCMWFGYNPQILFCHLFRNLNLVFFQALLLSTYVDSMYLVRVTTGVNQKVLPVLSTETLLHIWLSTEYYGFRPSSTAVDTVS